MRSYDRRSLYRQRNAFGCHASDRKLRETCVLMTEISAFLGVRPRAGPPRNSLQTRVESSGLPKTRCRLRIDLEPASIWGMSGRPSDSSAPRILLCKPQTERMPFRARLEGQIGGSNAVRGVVHGGSAGENLCRPAHDFPRNPQKRSPRSKGSSGECRINRPIGRKVTKLGRLCRACIISQSYPWS